MQSCSNVNVKALKIGILYINDLFETGLAYICYLCPECSYELKETPLSAITVAIK